MCHFDDMGLFRWLFGRRQDVQLRRVDLLARLDEQDARLDYLEQALRKLRGRVTGAERRTAPVDDAPGATIAPSDDGGYAPPRIPAVVPSIARARRALRGF